MDYRNATQNNLPCDYRNAINMSDIEKQKYHQMLLQDQVNANFSNAQMEQIMSWTPYLEEKINHRRY